MRIRFDFVSFEPITILSGKLKSLIASPSLKNSGFETIENLFLLFFFNNIFSISSPVVTGTVDLVIIILNLLIAELICLATLKIWLRSAELPPFFVGVPTQINMISESLTDFFISLEKFTLLFLQFFTRSSYNPGS